MRGRVLGIQFQHFLISRDRLNLSVGIFLERNALSEKPRHIGRNGSDYGRRTGDDIVSGGEIEHELASDRFDYSALVAEGNAIPGAKGAGLEQWIFHSRSLLLH